jgi:PLP dependent protein
MEYPGLGRRVADVRERVATAQAAAGWTHPVRIVAVTKTHGVDAVRAAAAAGLDAVGENRVQEALAKQEAATAIEVEWHLIGTLQRNKARQVVGRFALIHSVDRADLATELDRRAAPGASQSVLLQVNCSDEPQKGGVEPDGLLPLLEHCVGLGSVTVRGLMTMAALTDHEREQRRAFRRLRELRDAAVAAGHDLPELSMGMSGDYLVAVEEGASMIRLGTALFGERDT